MLANRTYCPICQTKAKCYHKHSLLPMVNENEADIYEIMLCSSCGFCFDNVKSETDFNDYYEQTKKYITLNTIGSGELSNADRVRYEDMLSKFSDKIDKNSFILDYGCGKGGFIKFLQGKGYKNVYGFDLSIENIHILQKESVKAYNSIDLLCEHCIKFDLVSSSYVLEHIYEFSDFFESLERISHDKSLLLLEVPDASDYFRDNFAPFYYFDAEHVNHFTKVSLENLLMRNGYCSIDSTYTRRLEDIINGTTCGGLFQKNIREENILNCDNMGIENIIKYIEISKKNDVYDFDHKKEAVRILWGLGAHARRILQEKIPLQSFDCIIDRNLAGSTLHGVPIMSSKILEEEQYNNATVFISSCLYQAEISNSIKKMKFYGEIINISAMEQK